jgi:hypothetical protein
MVIDHYCEGDCVIICEYTLKFMDLLYYIIVFILIGI